MKKILIIDDSALMRRAISDIINAEPDICVADTAENGKKAVDLLAEQKTYGLKPNGRYKSIITTVGHVCFE